MSVDAGPEAGHLDVPGGRLYYEVEGGGSPLVLIHAGVAHLRMWDEQVAAFAPTHRVIRYDTRGFGKTTTEDVPYSNRADLRALLEHLGVERTAVLGISRGGSIALDFTLESPEMVTALVLVAAGLSGFELTDDPLAETWAEMERLYEAGDREALVEMELRLWTDGPGQSRDRVSAELRRRMEEMGRENYAAAQPDGQPQALQPPTVGRLDEIRVPTLVMVGDLDVPEVIGSCDRIAEGIKGARRIVFPGVAHMVNLERPREFNTAVLDFLAKAGAPV